MEGLFHFCYTFIYKIVSMCVITFIYADQTAVHRNWRWKEKLQRESSKTTGDKKQIAINKFNIFDVCYSHKSGVYNK